MSTAEGGPVNRLAVASLVLALAWLAGVGSLLAVIFGFVAHRAIQRRGGTEAGRALAISGIVIGMVGLLGTFLTAAGLLAVGINGAGRAPRVLVPKVVDAGQAATISPPEAGLARITVFGVTNGVTADDPGVQPAAGDHFAVADIQVCAGPRGAAPRDLSVLWTLGLHDGSIVAPRGLPLKAPALDGAQALAARQCARGLLGFELANGATPDLVSFNGSPIAGILQGVLAGYAWRIPATS